MGEDLDAGHIYPPIILPGEGLTGALTNYLDQLLYRDAVDPPPQSGPDHAAGAHHAGLAGGIEGIAEEVGDLRLVAIIPDQSGLGMVGWVTLGIDLILSKSHHFPIFQQHRTEQLIASLHRPPGLLEGEANKFLVIFITHVSTSELSFAIKVNTETRLYKALVGDQPSCLYKTEIIPNILFYLAIPCTPIKKKPGWILYPKPGYQ